MPPGKSSQPKDIAFQRAAKEMLIRLHPSLGLKPYGRADGIDVQMKGASGVTWTVDVALIGQNGDLLLAECRRRVSDIEQAHVTSFSGEVDDVREAMPHTSIDAVMITKSSAQRGALTFGRHKGILIAEFPEDQVPQSFAFAFVRRGATPNAKVREHHGLLEETMELGASIEVVHKRGGKIVE